MTRKKTRPIKKKNPQTPEQSPTSEAPVGHVERQDADGCATQWDDGETARSGRKRFVMILRCPATHSPAGRAVWVCP